MIFPAVPNWDWLGTGVLEGAVQGETPGRRESAWGTEKGRAWQPHPPVVPRAVPLRSPQQSSQHPSPQHGWGYLTQRSHMAKKIHRRLGLSSWFQIICVQNSQPTPPIRLQMSLLPLPAEIPWTFPAPLPSVGRNDKRRRRQTGNATCHCPKTARIMTSGCSHCTAFPWCAGSQRRVMRCFIAFSLAGMSFRWWRTWDEGLNDWQQAYWIFKSIEWADGTWRLCVLIWSRVWYLGHRQSQEDMRDTLATRASSTFGSLPKHLHPPSSCLYNHHFVCQSHNFSISRWSRCRCRMRSMCTMLAPWRFRRRSKHSRAQKHHNTPTHPHTHTHTHTHTHPCTHTLTLTFMLSLYSMRPRRHWWFTAMPLSCS